MTMKLFDIDMTCIDPDDEVVDFDSAQSRREEEFWTWLAEDKPYSFEDVTHPDEEECEHIKQHIFRFIKEVTRPIAEGRYFDIPNKHYDIEDWVNIKFVIAFDPSFIYYPTKDDSDELDTECSERDYLDGITSFRYDVIKAIDGLALRGAALAKHIGSDTYRTWTDAMIKLADENEKVQCKAIEDVTAAIERIWADLRTWIFEKQADKPKKSKPKAKKAKK